MGTQLLLFGHLVIRVSLAVMVIMVNISIVLDGWMDGWMDGRKSRFKDCLQQSKRQFFVNFYVLFCIFLSKSIEHCKLFLRKLENTFLMSLIKTSTFFIKEGH